MKRDEAWKHVCAVVNDLGEHVPMADLFGQCWAGNARLVVWVTPMRTKPLLERDFHHYDLVLAIAVIHRDASLRIDDRTAMQLAIEYSTERRGERPSEPKYVL